MQVESLPTAPFTLGAAIDAYRGNNHSLTVCN
jgi:hypothetical protein